MKFYSLFIISFSLLLFSCSNNTTVTAPTKTAPKIQNKGHQLVYDLVQKVGDYNDLTEKKDVVYTYTYRTPDGKTDVSTEKYIFDGEMSYGGFKQHDRVYPDLKGLVEQGYDGKEFWLRYEGKYTDDEKMLKRVAFNRPTNFYWFTMLQKLMDPGLNYEHLGVKEVDGKNYDIVKVSFESKEEKPTDIYQLYINQKTKLVDQFLFTVVDFGRTEPMIMKMDYETVDGIMIPTKRHYKQSNWEGEISEDPWIDVTWSDIKFNNGLTKDIFVKKDL